MDIRSILLRLFTASAVVLVAACAAEEITKVPSKILMSEANEFGCDSLTVNNKAQTQDVSFTANGDWYIKIPKKAQSWLSISPSSGTTTSEQLVTVKVTTTLNENTEDRNASVAFVCDSLEQKALLVVTQSRMWSMTVTTNKSVINKNGGPVTFNVNANSDWTYSIDNEGKAWLKVENVDASSLTLAADPLEDVTMTKTGVVTFTSSKDPTLVAVFNISQKDIDLGMSASYLDVYRSGGSATIEVSTTNVTDWTPSSESDWIKVTKKDGKHVSVSISEIPASSKDDRNGTVVLTASDDPAVMAMLTINQYGPEAPSADLFDIRFDQDGSALDHASQRTITHTNGIYNVMSLNSVYGVYAPSFSFSMGGSKYEDSYYAVDLDSDMKTAMDDGYSLESICCINVDHNGGETKCLSSTKSGGTALMIGASNANYELIFLINVPDAGSTSSKWIIVQTGIKPVKGVYYHLLGTWDRTTGIASVYVDGQLKGQMSDLGRDMRYGTLAQNYFTVGGNQNSATNINGAWNGDVVRARIYGTALTAEDAKALYLQAFASHLTINK